MQASSTETSPKKRILFIGDAKLMGQYAPVPKTDQAIGIAWWTEVWDGKVFNQAESESHDLLPGDNSKGQLNLCIILDEFKKADIIFILGDEFNQLIAQRRLYDKAFDELLAGKIVEGLSNHNSFESYVHASAFVVATMLWQSHGKKPAFKFSDAEVEDINKQRKAAHSLSGSPKTASPRRSPLKGSGPVVWEFSVEEVEDSKLARVRKLFFASPRCCHLSTVGFFAGSALGIATGTVGVLGYLGLLAPTPLAMALLTASAGVALLLLVLSAIACYRRSPVARV